MRKLDLGFLTAGSVMIILFLILINYLTNPGYIWFVYPSLGLLLCPIGLTLVKKGSHKQFSLFYSALIIAYFIFENMIHTPSNPWVVFAIFPILWWPILTCLGSYSKTMTVAGIGSISTILYYAILNVILFPHYPWAIYPIFAVLWWPISLYHARKKAYVQFSMVASIFIIVFFICVNMFSSPHIIWAVYPIFVVLWWPLSMYYFVYKRKFVR